MKKILALLSLIASTSALAEVKTATYSDLTYKGTITVQYDCPDFSTLRAYACTSQRITAQYKSKTYAYEVKVPRGSDKLQKFWVSDISVGNVGPDGSMVIVVSYIDTSGSPSSAEEKYEVLDLGTNGKLKSDFGLMNYEQFEGMKSESELTLGKVKSVNALGGQQ